MLLPFRSACLLLILASLGARPAAAEAEGSISPAVLEKLGLGGAKPPEAEPAPEIQISQPNILEVRSALSTAVMLANEQSVNLVADWDGREDTVADRKRLLDSTPGIFLTRTAISGHTVANGFNENVYYYGDAEGRFWIGIDTDANGSVNSLLLINLATLIDAGSHNGVTLLNPSAGDFTSPGLVITGIAVNPVADLGDFGLCGTIGEIVYVSVFDAVGGATNASGQPFRSRIIAFALEDTLPLGAPNIDSAIHILRNPLANLGGVAVDDDGSLYFHLADLNQLSGGAIFKVQEAPRNVCASARLLRAVVSIPNGLSGAISLTSARGTPGSPILVSGGQRLSNYSWNSPTFGNVVAISAGPPGTIYAAVARSFNAEDDAAAQATEGLFTNPVGLGPTPSMVIALTDAAGAFDAVNGPIPGDPGPIPRGDGIADVALAGATFTAGVNNFRAFVLGNGPDPRGGALPHVLGTPENTLKLDMTIDFSIYAGITYDEDRKLYVISGGTPAAVGSNPSPLVSEVLCFPDSAPADYRADYIDFRGNNLPNPPASGGNVGDGDSDRFDHVFVVAPINPVTFSRTGLSGLSRGFLRYLPRLAPNPLSAGIAVGTFGENGFLTDDEFVGPLVFEDFDPGHQAAGGDDQNTPFRGDDNDGAGNAVLAGPLMGGFEFSFGGPVGIAGSVWNSFFLNANGSVSFGAGDGSTIATDAAFRSGPPKIAAAWTDLQPGARPGEPQSFPVIALGFAGINHFKVRFINVPRFDSDASLSRNSFSISLFDDGLSIDENANQPLNPANPIGNNSVPFDLQEGPTDLRFIREPESQVLIGENVRAAGTGFVALEYGSLDILGTNVRGVLAGYSVGGQDPNVPPGSCEQNLSQAALAADAGAFGAFGGIVMTTPFVIGDGTEPTIFEHFTSGSTPDGTNPGVPDLDLRMEGLDPAIATPATQPEPNRGYLVLNPPGSAPPTHPHVQVTLEDGLQTTPGTAGIINALCSADLMILGTGFFPDAATTVCSGAPEERAGKSLSTSIMMSVDVNTDGTPEYTIPLSNVTPVSGNLIRVTIPPAPGLPGTPFPLNLAGGQINLTITTTFSGADNNVFGPFVRNAISFPSTGIRAPVVLGVSGGSLDCSGPQTLTITGASFNLNGGPNVTGATLVSAVNPANVITGTNVMIADDTTVTATFDFTQGSPASSWLVHLTGPGGTSRNIVPPSAVCLTGNELGNLITTACENANRARDWELYR